MQHLAKINAEGQKFSRDTLSWVTALIADYGNYMYRLAEVNIDDASKQYAIPGRDKARLNHV